MIARTGRRRGTPHAAVRPPPVLVIVALLFVTFLAAPVITLLLRNLWGEAAQGAPGSAELLPAVLLSLLTTAVSLALTVLLGTPLAYALALGALPGRRVVETLVDLPLVLPPTVAGIALLLVFGRAGVLGEPLAALGLTIPFTAAAVVLAQLFVSAPLFVRAARAGFAAVDAELVDSARMDGASEWRLFLSLHVPLAGGALASGLVLAWARALGEFGATILFAGNLEGRTQTLPLLVYAAFQSGLGAALGAASLLVVIAFGVILALRTRPLSWTDARDPVAAVAR